MICRQTWERGLIALGFSSKVTTVLFDLKPCRAVSYVYHIVLYSCPCTCTTTTVHWRVYLWRDVVRGATECSSCQWPIYVLLAHPKVGNLAVALMVQQHVV